MKGEERQFRQFESRKLKSNVSGYASINRRVETIV
jgi:hypothetical protein